MPPFAILGTVVDATGPGAVHVRESVLVETDAAGRSLAVRNADQPGHAQEVAAAAARPGCIDLQLHAPQWPQAGRALDEPLERRRLAHTSPLEADLTGPGFASKVCKYLVAKLVAKSL